MILKKVIDKARLNEEVLLLVINQFYGVHLFAQNLLPDEIKSITNRIQRSIKKELLEKIHVPSKIIAKN